MTLPDTGFLRGCNYLLHDRKFCSAFDAILEAVGIQAIQLPTRSPNLTAYCERWIRSVKTELLLFPAAKLAYHQWRGHRLVARFR